MHTKKRVIFTGVFIQKKKVAVWSVRTAFAMPANAVDNPFKLEFVLGMPNQKLGINKVVAPPHFQPSSPPQRQHQYSLAAH